MLQTRERFLGWIAVVWGMALAIPLFAQTEPLPLERRADAERALQKALKTVEFITDPKEYAEAQIKIGLVWAQLGETDKANTAFQRVSQTLIQISEPSQRLEIEKNMFRAYARAGMWNQVVLAKTLPDPNERDELMTELVEIMANAQQTELALRTAREIERADARAKAYSRIARAQAQAGQYDEALLIARQIEDAQWRNEAFKGIAEAQMEADQLEEAFQTAQRVESESLRQEILEPLVEKFVESGKSERALQIAQQTESVELRINLLTRIASAQANAEQHEDARKTLQQILELADQVEDRTQQAMLLSLASALQARVGLESEAGRTLERAEEIANSIADAEAREEVLKLIAFAKAMWGEVQESLNILNRIEHDDPNETALALLFLSNLFRGSPDELIQNPERLREIEQILEASRDPFVPVAIALLYALAEQKVPLQLYERLLQNVAKADMSGRLEAIDSLTVFAGVFLKTHGNPEPLIQMAQKQDDPTMRALALTGIAFALLIPDEEQEAASKPKQVDEARERRAKEVLSLALESAKQIANLQERNTVLSHMAKLLSYPSTELAHQVADQMMGNPILTTQTLIAIAEKRAVPSVSFSYEWAFGTKDD